MALKDKPEQQAFAKYECVQPCTYYFVPQGGQEKVHRRFLPGNDIKGADTYECPAAQVVPRWFAPVNPVAIEARESQLEHPQKFVVDKGSLRDLSLMLMFNNMVEHELDSNGDICKHKLRVAEDMILGLMDDKSMFDDPSQILREQAIDKIMDEYSVTQMRDHLKKNEIKFFAGAKEHVLAAMIFDKGLYNK